MSSFTALLRDWANSLHVPNLLQGLTTGVRTTLVPIFAQQLGASEGQIGLIIGSAGFLKVILAIFFGFATTAFGCRKVMAAGMIVNAIGSCVAALAVSPVYLIFACMLWGAGIGAFFLARHVFIAKAVPRNIRGRLMSMVAGTVRWCSFLGPAMGGLLMDITGIRFTALSLVPISLGCFYTVMTDKAIKEMDIQIREEAKRDGVSNGVEDVLMTLQKYWDIVIRVGVYSFNILCLRQARPMLLALSAMRMGFSASVVGLVLSLSYIVDASLFFLGGYIMDRFGRKYAAIPTTLNLGLACCVLAWSTNLSTLLLAAFVFGLADSTGAGIVLTLTADYAPPRGATSFMALMRMAQDAGQVSGPIVCGMIIEHLSFTWVCYIMGILGFLNGLWALIMLPERSPGQLTEDNKAEEVEEVAVEVVDKEDKEARDVIGAMTAVEEEEEEAATAMTEHPSITCECTSPPSPTGTDAVATKDDKLI